MLFLAHQQGHTVSESDTPVVESSVMNMHAQVRHYRHRFATEGQRAHSWRLTWMKSPSLRLLRQPS